AGPPDRRSRDGGPARRVLPEQPPARAAGDGPCDGAGTDRRCQGTGADGDRAEMSTSAPAPIGVVAHYNLLERLEPAGPGELFRARDTRLGRTVVIRLLPEGFFPDSAARATFIEHAHALMALSHPNVTT